MKRSISIITINFNNSTGLQKTIESVISQTFLDFEFIIIDGLSTDNSVSIIESYAERITYWVSEADNGVYHAMNKGIKKSKGEYLLFLNSGDVLAHDRVLEEVYLSKMDTDIISGNAIYEESRLHEKKLIHSPKKIRASDLILSFLPHQATFIKHSLFDEIHYYNEKFKVVSDWAFFIEALLIHNKSYKSINLFVSICNTEGMSSNPKNNHLMDNEFHVALKELLPYYYDDFVQLRKTCRERQTEKAQVLYKIGESFIFKLIWKFRKLLIKSGFYKLKRNIKERKYLRVIKKTDERKKFGIKKKIYNLKSNMLKRTNTKEDVIVSVTSYGQRVENSLPYALYSIFTQSVLPSRIVLYLDENNWNDDNLPSIIREFRVKGLEVYYTEDIRSYKKLIPALEQFPDNPIITIDDDIYYAHDLIKSLLKEYYESDKRTVICHWACIQEKRLGKFIPYSQWMDSKYGNKYSIYSPFGGDGTLYPPYIFDSEILNRDVFMELAPTADDMWFWLMEYRCGVSVQLLSNTNSLKNENVNKLDLLKEKGSTALYFQNCVYGQNDIQFEKLLNYYELK